MDKRIKKYNESIKYFTIDFEIWDHSIKGIYIFYKG